MNRSKIAAGAFAVAGITALVSVAGHFGYLPSFRSPPRAPQQEPPIDFEGPLPNYSVLLSADTVDEKVRGAFASLRVGGDPSRLSLPGLSHAAAESVLAEAERDMTMFLSGSPSRYREWIERSGARNLPVAQAADPDEAWRMLEGFWESTVEPIRLRPIDPDGVIVRLRFLKGRDMGPFPEDLLVIGSVTSDHQFPDLSRDPRRSELTIVETLLPVMYIHNGKMEHAWFGIWYAAGSTDQRWRIWRTHIATYERPSNAGILPTI